ncbi:PLP-dependent aminotransferase family protein [Ralstonia pseudosolanacearum]
MHKSTLMYVATQMQGFEGPAYLRLVRALAAGIDSGELRAGVELPSQRSLAEHLGIHFTTVTRAYTEAKRRGLISAQRGRGTVVSVDQTTALPPTAASPTAMIDLASVWPPTLRIPFDLSAALVSLGGEHGVSLFSERANRRDPDAVAPAIAWLQPRFSSTLVNRVTASAGTRAALMALMPLVVGNGGTLLAESMVWPKLKTLAAMYDIRLHPIAMDEQGIVPTALATAVRETGAKALYCVVNGQNPTNAVMSLQRRQEIAAVAMEHDLKIFEDDVYGELIEQPLPPLANLAPRQGYYIASLSKCLSPSLRVAYIVAPTVEKVRALDDLLRATMLSPAPIEEALAMHTMRNKSAFRHIARVRSEARARSAIVAEIFREMRDRVRIGPLSAWLTLPESWKPAEFVEALRRRGIAILPSDVFMLSPAQAGNSVRIATGAARNQDELRQALSVVLELLASSTVLTVVRT